MIRHSHMDRNTRRQRGMKESRREETRRSYTRKMMMVMMVMMMMMMTMTIVMAMTMARMNGDGDDDE